jgi:hypothetical protein
VGTNFILWPRILFRGNEFLFRGHEFLFRGHKFYFMATNFIPWPRIFFFLNLSQIRPLKNPLYNIKNVQLTLDIFLLLLRAGTHGKACLTSFKTFKSSYLTVCTPLIHVFARHTYYTNKIVWRVIVFKNPSMQTC